MLYAANVGEGDLADGNVYVEQVRTIAEAEGAGVVLVSAEFEAQLAELDPEERVEFLAEAGQTEPGLHRLIRAAYDPVMPVAADDASHALRLAARIGQQTM